MKFLLLFLISFHSIAQSVPTQRDLMKKNGWRLLGIPAEYFRMNFWDEFSDFQFIQHLHNKNIKNKKTPFYVFSNNKHYLKPYKKSHTAFANSNEDFSDLAITDYGVCSGMTYIMRKFHLLAYFDFRNQFDQKVPSKVDSKEWIKYYKKLINQVYKLKPVIIPHFRGLHDLTNHPVLGRYIKKLVLAQWIQKNVSLKGFIQLKSTTAPKMSKSAVKTLYKQLKTRLSYNYNPIVYLSKRSQKIFDEDSWIHVLNVFDISLNKDHFSISLWDTNSTNMKYVSKTVKIYSNGKISGDFSDLIGIHLYPEDDREIAQIVFNKSEWCTKSKKINRLCRGELDL